MTTASIYDRWGVPRVINGAGTLTRLSGTLLAPGVAEAMSEASRAFVRMDQLHAAASVQIAQWTGAEAGIVTCGAAASLTLAAAACLARFDLARMEQLPETAGLPNEIIIPRSHRNGYDHALRAAGAHLVEVGIAERTRDPQAWEIEAAINDRTVGVAYAVGFSPLDLTLVVEAAHRHELPVIVDASAALPPKANLRAFIDAGADLVAFSGGKGLRGPQSSGLLCGRRDLVASAALQMWDLDFVPELWNPPPALIDPDLVRRGVPNHGIGRAMKVGKEEIVGLLTALEQFVAADEEAEYTRLTELATRLAAELVDFPAADVVLLPRADRWPIVCIEFTPGAPRTAIDVARALETGSPPVYLATGEAPAGRLAIDPCCLQPGDTEILVAKLHAAFGG